MSVMEKEQKVIDSLMTEIQESAMKKPFANISMRADPNQSQTDSFSISIFKKVVFQLFQSLCKNTQKSISLKSLKDR